jgi:glycosyltransferase involved in cell wall biosynthesis
VAVLEYSPLALPGDGRELRRLARQLARDVRLFQRLLRARRPSRVIVVTTALPSVLLAARAEGVQALVYAAEVIPTSPGLPRRAVGQLVKRFTRSHATAILSCSAVVAAQFEGPPAPLAATAYPPIEPLAGLGDGDRLRARLRIPAGARCVAAAGSISRGRGQDTLIKAMPRLSGRFPGLRVVLAGEPHPRSQDLAYREEILALANTLGVRDALVLAGFVDPIADLYAAADVVVNPARRESFGRVAAEALAAGRPVVATRVGGVSEVLRDGVDALLVPPDEPDVLADAVARVLDDAALADRLVAAGAERVLTEFSAERAHASFAELLAAMTAAD